MKNVTIVDENELVVCGESELSEILIKDDANNEENEYNDDFEFEL